MAKYEKVEGTVVKLKRDWKFTEKLIISILIYCFMVCNIAIVFAFVYGAESIWWYIIPAIGAVSTSGLGFFIWKEKSENLIKIAKNPDYEEEQFKSQIEYQLQQEMLDIHRDDSNNQYF